MRAEERLALQAVSQCGVFTRAQALVAGFTTGGIRWALATGRWRAVFPGVYRASGTPNTWHLALMAAVLSAGPDAVASFVSAGALWGLIEWQPAIHHVTRCHARHDDDLPGRVVHRARSLGRGDRSVVDDIPVTCVPRTLVDLARLLMRPALEAAVDEALHRRLTTVHRVQRYIETRNLGCLKGAGVLGSILLDRTEGVPESELERMLLRLLRSAGMLLPARQRRWGRYRVDFAYLDRRVVIELDGRRHLSPRVHAADCERDRDLGLAGWLVLRFTWRDLTERPEVVVRDIGRALAKTA